LTPLRHLRDPTVLAAFGFGAGLAPWAPGTFGTLLAIPLWWIVSGTGLRMYLLLAAAGFVVGIWICNRATTALGEHDHPGIVIDEVVGYFAALVVVPPDLVWLALSFLVFRMFDIFKPWPINWLDRKVGGGLGIMLDDLIAGVFTAAVMVAVIRLSE
jgi:phosphatidylglycerophosphatase A